MAYIIALANQKGGVGKTTTAVNLAAALAIAEKRILLADVDPQANSSSSLAFRLNREEPCIYDLLTDSVGFAAVVRTTPYNLLEVVPSHIRLVGAEIELVSFPERELVLRKALAPVGERYDFILLDCPPSLGLLTLNGLTAANGVLIPLQAEYFALEGLTQLLQTIRLVQKRLNPGLRLEGIFLTMYDPRLNLARQVREELQRYFPEHTYNTIINRNVRLAEAPSYGKPVMHFAVSSPGARDYLMLAEEFLERHKRPLQSGSNLLEIKAGAESDVLGTNLRNSSDER